MDVERPQGSCIWTCGSLLVGCGSSSEPCGTQLPPSPVEFNSMHICKWDAVCACSVCQNATWHCTITPECSGGRLGEVHCPHNQVYKHHDSTSCTLTCATYDIGCPASLTPHDACGCPSNTVMAANVRPLFLLPE